MPATVVARRSWRRAALAVGLLIAAAAVYFVWSEFTMPALVQTGDRAPLFSATAQSGQQVSLADYLGKQTVVLYFYPRQHAGLYGRSLLVSR